MQLLPSHTGLNRDIAITFIDLHDLVQLAHVHDDCVRVVGNVAVTV